MRSLKGKEEKAMETHKRDFHDDSKRVTCTVCQKEYPNLNMLKTHLRVHVVVEGKSSDNNYSSKYFRMGLSNLRKASESEGPYCCNYEEKTPGAS